MRNEQCEMENQEVLISTYAIAKILAIDALDVTKESAGLLIGHYDEQNDQLIITDIDTGRQKQTATYVVIDDEALVKIVEDLQTRGSNEYIIGWWHTHPGYGCFLSGTDKGTQRTYQNLFPNAVAMVVDPSKYYKSHSYEDLEIKFFRMINDFDYKSVPFVLYYDDHTRHLTNLVQIQPQWTIPKLPESEVIKLKEKLYSINGSLSNENKELVSQLIDVMSTAVETPLETNDSTEVLQKLDEKLDDIQKDVSAIYHQQVSNIYSILNIIAVVILVFAWFVIAYLT